MGQSAVTSDNNAALQTVRIVSAASARDAIARCVLEEGSEEMNIGGVSLYSHQLSAVHRIRQALRDFGGALLFDAVGLGKTYTALAVATRYKDPLIVAPAVLRTMWQRALGDTRIEADFTSVESLSRGANIGRQPSFIIVDEAHHLRNPSTRRYAEVARLCIHAPVLLLSATQFTTRAPTWQLLRHCSWVIALIHSTHPPWLGWSCGARMFDVVPDRPSRTWNMRLGELSRVTTLYWNAFWICRRQYHHAMEAALQHLWRKD